MGDTHVVQADGRGRVLLPRTMRERLGIGPHTPVAVEERDDGSVVLRDVRTARERLLDEFQGSWAGGARSSDDLIAERRRDAASEIAPPDA